MDMQKTQIAEFHEAQHLRDCQMMLLTCY